MQLPPPLGPPISALGQPAKAFQCNDEACEFISINRKEMLKHCNKMHGWGHSTGNPAHWNTVHVQTFFISSGFRRYFTVQVSADSGSSDNSQSADLNPIPADADADTDDTAAAKREWADARKRHQQELEVANSRTAKTDRTGWFN